MSAIGKTIAAITERDSDVLLVHFTDGTGLEITGHSYEEVDLDHDERSYREMRQLAAVEQGKREKKRLERLRDLEWISLPCEERARRRYRSDRAKAMHSFGIIPNELGEALLDDIQRALNRSSFAGGTPSITRRTSCERCGDVRCPNAGTRTVAGYA